ncbi:MAG TPA: DUF1259 domain-containing protein [Beijerinckiaceae bacterium]|jgi:hypothetical protein|nr:DUF1259 domain-containing protein [Beijerinckiaceae bacterium]
MRATTSSIAAFLSLTLAGPALADPDWKAVAQALGKEGAAQGGVYRVGFPRSDLKVTLDGTEIKPGLALGGWVAFAPIGNNDAMIMGDLVLTQDEVNPVMKKLIDAGLEITALHNHLLRSEPATMYMHVGGHGDAVKLAAALREGLSASKTPMGAPAAAAPAPEIDFDTAAVDAAMGRRGKANGPIYQFSISRAGPVKDAGMVVPEAMGSAIAINFQPTGGGKAAITGDFVLTADEVNPTLKALRANDIEVTALHSHMLDEQPRLYFMHFWANDDAEKLAKGLAAALSHVKIAKS